MNDLESESRFPVCLGILRQHGLKSYCWLPLTTADKRLGALGLGSSHAKPTPVKTCGCCSRVAN